jgi:hypothetical protein
MSFFQLSQAKKIRFIHLCIAGQRQIFLCVVVPQKGGIYFLSIQDVMWSELQDVFECHNWIDNDR